jgi:hypothetical protein
MSRRRRPAGSRGFRLGSPATRAAALLGLLLAGLVLYGLSTAGAFAIRRIEVSPLRWTDRAAVLDRLGLAEGTNAFRLATTDLPDRLAGLPAVVGAAVRVALPDTLVVTVTERTPILAWRVGDATFLGDRDGVLFALATPGDDSSGLPTINDDRLASRTGLAIGSTIDPVDLDVATRLASLTPADIGSTAAALVVGITDADGFVVTTTPPSWTAVFGVYGHAVRTPNLVPGQVRLLRSLLDGREAELARIVLADDRNGTYLPQPTAR